MLEINGLSIAYGSVEVVHGVTMHVDEGKIVALIGPNGAGKSSVLKAISGLLVPSSGEIAFLGTSLIGVPPHEIASAGIGHVMEGRHLFGGLTVEDNLLLAGASDVSQSAGSIEAVFQRWPVLNQRRQQLAGNLSGGEQQMLAIGRALIARPRLMMLDEPSWGLAPKVVRDLMKTILELRSEGMTVLLVEQMANLALKICDYGYVMSNGRIALEGTAQKLLSHPGLQASYLGGKVSSNMPVIKVSPGVPKKKAEVQGIGPEETGDYRRREAARQEKESRKRESVSPVQAGSGLRMEEPQEFPIRGFEERERWRRSKEKSFGVKEPLPDLKQELDRIRTEISELKSLQLISPVKTPYAKSPAGKDWEELERQRLAKQAGRQEESVSAPGKEEIRNTADSEFRIRELARMDRESRSSEKPKVVAAPMGSRRKDFERERQERQEKRKAVPVSSQAEEAVVAAVPKGATDRKAFEMRRNEKAKGFFEKSGQGRSTGREDHGKDRRAQELDREQREATRLKKEHGSLSE